MMMSCPRNFVHVSITENYENLIFRYDNVNLTFCSPLNKWGIIFLVTNFNTEALLLPASSKKKWILFYKFIQIVRVWHHHLTEMNIHEDWSRTVFRKYWTFQKFLTSLFLIPFSWFLYQAVEIIFYE